MTKYITLQGPARWLRVTKEKMDTKYGEKFSLDLVLDEANKQKLLDTGWRGKIKVDAEGEEFAKFSRNNVQNFGDKVETLGPPKLYKADGKTLWEEGVEIGNGSTASILLEIYESKKYGVGSRLMSVSILNHVPYERTDQPDLPF